MLLLALAGWVNQQQLAVIEYLKEENRVLRELHGRKRLRFTDDQRRRLAAKGKAIGRRILREIGTVVTPDTILCWHRRLIAKKYDGSEKRRPGGHMWWRRSGCWRYECRLRMSGGATRGSSES